MGYRIRAYPVEYVGTKDGRPFTLVDCLRETEGMAMCSIIAPNGRVVLEDAGSHNSRQMTIRRARARRWAR